jgi:hypothetical protein
MGAESTWRMVRPSGNWLPPQKSQFPSEDDFEAFKALAKASLYATVAVIIPENMQVSSNSNVCFHPFIPVFSYSRWIERERS